MYVHVLDNQHLWYFVPPNIDVAVKLYFPFLIMTTDFLLVTATNKFKMSNLEALIQAAQYLEENTRELK